MSTQRRPGSLTTRLLVAQIGVAVASALTMLVVAAIVGPPLFEAHMHQAGHNSPDVLAHSQEAFSVAGTLALGIGLAIGATGAVMVSVLISRRLRRSLDDLGAAAVRISRATSTSASSAPTPGNWPPWRTVSTRWPDGLPASRRPGAGY